MVIDMANFSIPMYLHVNIDDDKINAIDENIVLDDSAFDQAIANLIREELVSTCKNVENIVEINVFIEDIPYQDYVYED